MDHAHPPAEPRAGRSLLAVGGPAAAAAIIISIVGLTTGDFGRLAEPVISAGLVVAAAAFFVALRFTDVMERAALKAQASRLAALSVRPARF